MLNKLPNLFGDQPENSTSPENTTSHNKDLDTLESQIELADSLGQKGEVQQTVNLYQNEIQQNPNTEPIKIKLAKLLEQQKKISESYRKLAESLKNQGNPEQAAEYYRQAIMIKSLIRGSEPSQKSAELVLRNPQSSSLTYNLSKNAFSFIPLKKSFSKPGNPSSQNTKLSKNPNIARETIQLYAEKALDGYDDSQWQETVDACQKILEISPEMAEAYKILGNALQRMGQTGKAMECYAKALKIQPDLAIVYAGIGKLYHQQQKWFKAKEYYQKATIINPRYPEAYRNLAYVWQQLDQPGKAEFCRKRAVSIEKELLSITSSPSIPQNNSLPDSTKASSTAQAYYNLAQNLEQNQKWQEAAVHYRKAVELNNIYLDSNTKTKADLAQLPAKNHDSRRLPHRPQEFLNDISEGVLMDTPSDNRSLSQTTEAAIKTGQIERAIKRYNHQTKIQPSSAKLQFDLGNLYSKNKDWEKAIASYRQAIKIESTYRRAYINLGKALAQVGKRAESLDQLYLGYTINPEIADVDNLFNLGKALVGFGDRKRAVNCYSLVVNLKPNFVAAYHILAENLVVLGRKNKAMETYYQAVRHNPQDTDSYFALGELHSASKQWDNAVESYRRVLEIQPKYPKASYKLSYVLAEKIKSDLNNR